MDRWIHPFNRSRDYSSILNHNVCDARLPQAGFIFLQENLPMYFTILSCTLRYVTLSDVFGVPPPTNAMQRIHAAL